MSLRDFWYIAAESPRVAEVPLAATIMGEPVVVYRDGGGRTIALEDRCAHRNMALSLGRVKEGAIECSYHGWRYGSDGRCAHIPSLASEAALPRHTVRAYPTVEQQGYVWLWLGAGMPEAPPPELAKVGAPGWITFRMRTRFEGTVDDCLE